MTLPASGTQADHPAGRALASKVLLLALGALLLLSVAASVAVMRTGARGLIASDGKGYYAWLRSLALDRDLDFTNDYTLIYPPDPLPVMGTTPGGLPHNQYPVGLALAELPGFAAGHAAAIVSGAPTDGVGPPYQFGVTLWLQMLCVGSLALLWLALVRLGADPVVTTLGVVSAFAATNLVQYIARPAMSHGPGLAVLCLAFYVAVALARSGGTIGTVALLGALLGLAVIIRPTNVALAPFFAPFVARAMHRSTPRWAVLSATFVSVASLQVILMSSLWGELTVSGYGEHQPGFTSGVGGIAGTLFSARHGLFVYHPWYLVTLALAFLALRRPATRSLAAGTLVSFVALTVVNGTWWSWWFGDGFGNRAFIEMTLPLAVTSVLWLSGQASRMRRLIIPAAVVGVMAASNALLWTGFVLRRYPPDGQHSVADAYLWPWRS